MKRSKFIVFTLMLVFFLPGLSAYYLFNELHWTGFGKTTNKGELIRPAQFMESRSSEDKWRLILWEPQKCESECMRLLDKLARTRLALGRHLYKIDLTLLTNTVVDKSIEDAFLLQDIKISSNLSAHDSYFLPSHKEIYLQNPDGYLILNYDINLASKDILHDIKHLLTQEG